MCTRSSGKARSPAIATIGITAAILWGSVAFSNAAHIVFLLSSCDSSMIDHQLRRMVMARYSKSAGTDVKRAVKRKKKGKLKSGKGGKGGKVKSRKQAIAIGLSEARKKGKKVPKKSKKSKKKKTKKKS
jgi:hypothetical protein